MHLYNFNLVYFFKYGYGSVNVDLFRRCCSQIFFKIGALKNFAKFTGKDLCRSLIFDKVADIRPATSFKKRHRYLTQVFFCKFWKILKNSLIYRTLPVAEIVFAWCKDNIALDDQNRTLREKNCHSQRCI